MVNKKLSTIFKAVSGLILISSFLIGCIDGKSSAQAEDRTFTPEGTHARTIPSDTPQADFQATPTRIPEDGQNDSRPARNIQDEVHDPIPTTSSPHPTTTPTLDGDDLCQPFPDSLQYLGNTQLLGNSSWTIKASCQGQQIFFRSPVGEMTLYDYSPLTGRFTYGSANNSGQGLWVYDFWTELSEKWLDVSVSQAEWALVRSPQGVQHMAILHGDGSLSIATGPFQIETIADGVTEFSLSPAAERIAYIKDNVLYVVGVNGGQPKKLAEEAYGKPRWVNAGTVIILPSSPVKFIKLDGSATFKPNEMPSVAKRIEYLCNGKLSCSFSTNLIADRLLWNERTHLLVFYASTPTDEAKFRTLYVYELSEDLRTIVNRQTIFGEFTNQIAWDVPGDSLIDSAQNSVKIGPPHDVFYVPAKIISKSNNELGVELMWTNSWASSRYGHQFLRVHITDQSHILDVNGEPTSANTLKVGMTIGLTARRLSVNSLSLFAYTIHIQCDQIPCYLGFEGRS